MRLKHFLQLTAILALLLNLVSSGFVWAESPSQISDEKRIATELNEVQELLKEGEDLLAKAMNLKISLFEENIFAKPLNANEITNLQQNFLDLKTKSEKHFLQQKVYLLKLWIFKKSSQKNSFKS